VGTANNVNMPQSCGSGLYNGCSGSPPGFNWLDTLGPATVDNVTVRFQIAHNCDGTTLNATLNGGTEVSHPAAMECSCNFFAGDQSTTVTLPGSDYVMAGTNTFLSTNVSTCRGFYELGSEPGRDELAFVCLYGTCTFAFVLDCSA
jgi:hypothetical protein